MLIDCDTCVARGGACRDCVVTLLLASPPAPSPPVPSNPTEVDLDDDERRAFAVLASAGLVPPLRLVAG